MSKITKSCILASAIVLGGLLSACSENEEKDINNVDEQALEMSQDKTAKDEIRELKMVEDEQQSSKLVTLKGQVLFQEMEGGFFSFIADDGKKYTPMGMPKEHLRHGLFIQLTGQPLPDMITTTQFGEVIRVEKVLILDDSKVLKADRPAVNPQDL